MKWPDLGYVAKVESGGVLKQKWEGSERIRDKTKLILYLSFIHNGQNLEATKISEGQGVLQ